ncbi:hypothetical protein JW859_10360 [bacterium]|nr:hypothetical protein [bacterium]
MFKLHARSPLVHGGSYLPFLLVFLVATGLAWPSAARAQDDDSAEPGDITPAADPADDELDEIWESYLPPMPLITTNELTKTELYRERDGELAATIFTPRLEDLNTMEGFPAMDLHGFIGYTSGLDPAFENLALELARWQHPEDATDVASIQLLQIHTYCNDPEMKGMPEITVLGDATSLYGDVYEVIILHPLNVPLAGAHVIPVDPCDSFGVTMLMLGSLASDRWVMPEPVEIDYDALSEEEQYFTILPEYLPPVDLQSVSLLETYKIVGGEGGTIGRLAVPAWAYADSEAGFPALDLYEFMHEAVREDMSFANLGVKLAWEDVPADMVSLPSWQLMITHLFCGYPDNEEFTPELEHYGYSTFLFGDERDCVLVHPRNIPIAGAIITPENNDRDFINLLTAVGELIYYFR